MRHLFKPVLIALFCVSLATNSFALVNGSFEDGLTGWTFNAGVEISPYAATVPPAHGSNFIHIGINDISGSMLSQATPVIPGSSNLLTFGLATLGDPGRIGITRVTISEATLGSVAIIASATYTNEARNVLPFPFIPRVIPFKVPDGVSSVTVSFSDLSPFHGVAVDPLLDNVKVTLKSPFGLVNGSFEDGLSGWTGTAGVQISPFPELPPSDGTNCVHLGLNNLPGAVLSQNFPVVPGSSNLLSFDLFALIDNRLATVTIVRVELVAPSGILTSQTFTNTGRNTPPITYQTLSVQFTVPAEVSNLTLRFVDLTPNSGIAADPILDNVRILPPSSSSNDCSSVVASLQSQLAAANAANAELHDQLTVLNESNAVLRARVTVVESTNLKLRSQLTSANRTIGLLQRQLTAANMTITRLQGSLATALSANATLRAQLNAANAENQRLRNQAFSVTQSITGLEDFFADEYNDPTFLIPGGTTELQVSNLVSAIQDLNSTQQRALLKILARGKVKTRR